MSQIEPNVCIDWNECPELAADPSLLDRVMSLFDGEENDEEALDDDEQTWGASRVVYAYFLPDEDEPFYIGKSWSTTVYSRLMAKDKAPMDQYLRSEYSISRDDLVVFAGKPKVSAGRRLTRQLLADIESLLIFDLRPEWNKASTRNRGHRESLVVECVGDWPHRRSMFLSH